ncbi:hypothetical protein [Saccharothrix sp. ALI-22-I]|nr:hypothetical protein [Saccharothrix sp. ALI-22-I]
MKVRAELRDLANTKADQIAQLKEMTLDELHNFVAGLVERAQPQ